MLLKQRKWDLGRREQNHHFFCETWKTRGVFSKLIIERQRAVNITASLAFRFSLKLIRRRDSSKEAISEVLDASKAVLLDNSKENQIAIKSNCSSPLFVYQLDSSVPVTTVSVTVILFFPPSLIPRTADGEGLVEKHYVFLKRLCQVLCALGSQLCALLVSLC